jgi:hypothetical protein
MCTQVKGVRLTMRGLTAALMMGCAMTAIGQGASSGQSQALQAWTAVERLKPGTQIDVGQDPEAGGVSEHMQCRVVRVDSAALSCVARGKGRVPAVYPVGQIDSVALTGTHVTTRVHPVRMVLWAGGYFLIGSLISTVDNGPENYALATSLAGVAALAGLQGVRTPRSKVIYRRTGEVTPISAQAP